MERGRETGKGNSHQLASGLGSKSSEELEWRAGIGHEDRTPGEGDNVKTIAVPAFRSLWDHARALPPGFGVTGLILAHLLVGTNCYGTI